MVLLPRELVPISTEGNRVVEKMNRAWGPDTLTSGLGPCPPGSYSLMGRGLPCPLALGDPLDDELLLGVLARLGRLEGGSGRQLSRPWRGQVSTVTAAAGRREGTPEAEMEAQQRVKCS